MKIFRAGYTNFLNMFKTFVLICRNYTPEKNTFRMDCHCHCHCQNDQEWSPIQTRMDNSSSFSSIFSTVRLGHKLCNKEDNYTFSMHITRNEKYSHWEQESIEHVQTFCAGLPIVIVIADCHCHCHCQNDQEWSPYSTRMVNLSLLGSRFGTVSFGHNGAWL